MEYNWALFLRGDYVDVYIITSYVGLITAGIIKDRIACINVWQWDMTKEGHGVVQRRDIEIHEADDRATPPKDFL